jgi:hypothetical protein
MTAPVGYLWVLLQLLHAQRDAAVVRVDAQNDGIDLIARLHQLRRVLHSLGPGHLGYVNESFDSLLQLNERAVVGD